MHVYPVEELTEDVIEHHAKPTIEPPVSVSIVVRDDEPRPACQPDGTQNEEEWPDKQQIGRKVELHMDHVVPASGELFSKPPPRIGVHREDGTLAFLGDTVTGQAIYIDLDIVSGGSA